MSLLPKFFKSKLTRLGSAAPAALFAAALGIGFAAAPAHASNDELNALEWDDGTSDFIDDYKDMDDKFIVQFSPAFLGGQAASSFSQGKFNDYFGTPPIALFDVDTDPELFMIEGSVPAPGTPWKNQSNIDFLFDTPGGEVLVYLPAKSQWAGIIEQDEAVSLVLLEGEFEYEFLTGIHAGMTGMATSSEFDFGQVPNTIGGGYEATFVEDVPGPLPLFGAAMAFGYSRKLRQRLKSSVSV